MERSKTYQDTIQKIKKYNIELEILKYRGNLPSNISEGYILTIDALTL